MAVIANRRSVMTFFSDPECPHSHRCRIVLSQKGVNVEVYDVDPDNLPEDLLELNPYGSTPTLVDRDLVLFESNVIMEYLDERFPHPPLMPVYPVARAKTRLMMYRMQKDLYTLVNKIAKAMDAAEKESARKELKENLVAISPIFEQMPYFMSEELSLADCCLIPVVWRLPHLGVQLPAAAKPLLKYAEEFFARDAFVASLSEAEKNMRHA